MKTIKYITICLFLSIFTSCGDFLDLTPTDTIAPEEYYNTEAELNSALNGVYRTLSDANLYKALMLGRLGLDADQAYNVREVNGIGQYYVIPTDKHILSLWQALYVGINNANLLLQNIDKESISISDTERERIKGETLFLRGYFYFLLVTNFGDVPLVLKSADSPKEEQLNIPRSPAKEVYERILKDMEYASSVVSNIKDLNFGGRVSKSAIYGIMARVYLYSAGRPLNINENYEKAREYAKKVMDLGVHELNQSYEQVFINYAQDIYDIKESIWEVEFTGNGIGVFEGLGGQVGIVNGIRCNDPKIGAAYETNRVTKQAYVQYENGDLRRDRCIAPFEYRSSGTGDNMVTTKNYFSSSLLFNRNIGKFRRENEILTPKHASRSPQNYPLLRYADVLLMFAESDNEFHKGPSVEAYEALNQVRRRAFGKNPLIADPTVDISGKDYYEFQDIVRKERGRELAYESLRKADLVRWGIFLQSMKQCYEDALVASSFSELKNAVTTYNNASARDTIWPIPSSEIILNPTLTQNNGW